MNVAILVINVVILVMNVENPVFDRILKIIFFKLPTTNTIQYICFSQKRTMKYQNIREEEIKNKVGQDFFSNFDTTKIVGNIDFCVSLQTSSSLRGTKQSQISLFETPSLLWAEAKRGTFDVLTMITQLVLTIGKARTFDKFLPPAFLGAFDSQKIGFVPYNAIMDVFSMNDFNWNVTPSNHETREFNKEHKYWREKT